jgi:hypothetical protein
LGNPNNGNAPGPLFSGRREINWDGGGNNPDTAIAGTPFNGFLNTRGAQFTTEVFADDFGSGFIQATPEGFSTQFGDDPNLSTTFADFSPLRIFSPIGSNITDIGFFIPGPNAASQPATAKNFGAIFTDVDFGFARIEFFDIHNHSIFSQDVSSGSFGLSGSFSFLGAIGDAGEQIFRVRITSGNFLIGFGVDGEFRGHGPPIDLVAMDDFIYSEPRAVPESGGGVTLLGLGLVFLFFWHCRSLVVS